MEQIITLQNEQLAVKISTVGAEIISVQTPAGTEFMWEGDGAVWGNHAPLMFPICGGLKDDAYTLDGKTYTLKKHGFMRNTPFTLGRVSENEAELYLEENEERLAAYPFSFHYTATFLLVGNTLSVTYTVKNRSEDTMYFNVGSHEAYALPEGVEAYEILFAEEEELYATPLHGNLLPREKVPFFRGQLMPVKADYFAQDAVVLEELRSRCVTLRKRGGGRSIKVEFPGIDHLLIWQKYNARFLCIEPWTGLPDYEDTTGILSEKPGITSLLPGKTYVATHCITFRE